MFSPDRNLPIWRCEKKILGILEENDVMVIVGETASGKSTQIPQLIYNNGLNIGFRIACTQPRRVAAMSLAKYLSTKIDPELIGYSVRFESSVCEETIIKFLTDGMFLKEIMREDELDQYSYIIIDECHERTINSEVILGILKQYLIKRNSNAESTGLPKLKLIIMSATMDVDLFRNYFNQCPVIFVEGKPHKINIFYSDATINDYISAAISTIVKIDRFAPQKENILCFLTGQDEIESIHNYLLKYYQTKDEKKSPLILKLFSNLPHELQMKVFEPSSNRKIILSTNVAETSLTIPDIVHVIDTGKVKVKSYSKSSFNYSTMEISSISQASAWQRAGRAGRECTGFCYRLYSEEQFKLFEKYPLPEILKSNLDTVLIQMFAAGVNQIQNFQFLEPPPDLSIKSSLTKLKNLQIIAMSNGYQNLTERGQFVSHFPVSAEISLAILKSIELNCVKEILTIASFMCIDFPLKNHNNNKISHLTSKFGDHLTFLKIQRYLKHNLKKPNNSDALNFDKNALKFSFKIYEQLLLIVKRLFSDISLKDALDEEDIIRSLLFGFRNNIAQIDSSKAFYKDIKTGTTLYIHPQSTLFRSNSEFVFYTEIVQTTKAYMKGVSYIQKEWINSVL